MLGLCESVANRTYIMAENILKKSFLIKKKVVILF